MAIGDRIKEQRIKSGLTLFQVAEKLGVKEATVQRYESGSIKNLKQDTIGNLAEILHTTPAYLMGWEQKEEPANKDELDNELISMVKSLSPEKRNQAVDFLRFLKGTQDNQK